MLHVFLVLPYLQIHMLNISPSYLITLATFCFTKISNHNRHSWQIHLVVPAFHIIIATYYSVKLWQVIWWPSLAPLLFDISAQFPVSTTLRLHRGSDRTTLMCSASVVCRANTFSSSFFALLFFRKVCVEPKILYFSVNCLPQWNQQPHRVDIQTSRHQFQAS